MLRNYPFDKQLSLNWGSLFPLALRASSYIISFSLRVRNISYLIYTDDNRINYIIFTMAKAPRTTASTSVKSDLTVKETLGFVVLKDITIKTNKTGIKKSRYINIPGLGLGKPVCVYARVDEIEKGVLYKCVELSNGAFALNDTSREDMDEYLNNQMAKFPNLGIDWITRNLKLD